jgi:protein-tyrosine phosphatase
MIKNNALDITADSAGTSSWHKGEAPCSNSIKVAQRHHINISDQRSRPITSYDKTYFDYVIALDRQNQTDLETLGFQNVYLLGDFGGYEGKDVPDPYYFPGFEGFEKVYTMIENATFDLLEKIKDETI